VLGLWLLQRRHSLRLCVLRLRMRLLLLLHLLPLLPNAQDKSIF
jgi:hypothetical protein